MVGQLAKGLGEREVNAGIMLLHLWKNWEECGGIIPVYKSVQAQIHYGETKIYILLGILVVRSKNFILDRKLLLHCVNDNTTLYLVFNLH